MPKNYFVDVRMVTKKQLLKFIKDNIKDHSITKILGLFSLKTGLRVSTLETYVKELRDAELIE